MNRKRKVLFVATVDSHIELFLLPYLEMLKNAGYEIHVATGTSKPINFCDKKIQLPITRSPLSSSNLKAMKKLKKIINEEDYDIIHCHTPVGGVVARLAAKNSRKTGTRVIYTAHGFHFYKGAPLHYWMIFYPIEKYLAKYTDTLITINQEDYKRAKNKFSKRCNNIEYIPGVGINENKIKKPLTKKQKQSLRKSLGIKEGDIVLTCIGRLDANKNQGLLIKAMRNLTQKNKNYKLLLIGKDELSGKYQKQASSMKENIIFTGFKKNVADFLQISDILVSVSKREGLPVNVMEAMHLGLPCIVTNCRGNRDLIKDGCGGKIIPINKKEALISAIETLCKNPKLRKKYGEYNKKESQKYIFKNIKDGYAHIYFKKKVILHLLASNKFSGAENVACTIIDGLKNDFDFVYCSPGGPISKTLKEKNINYIPMAKCSVKELKKIVDKYNPKIIHAHDYKASLIAALCRKPNVVKIAHIHKDDPSVKKISPKSLLFRWSQKYFYKTIWVSEIALKNYRFHKKYPEKNTVMQNVVNPENIKKLADAAEPESCDVLYLGRLEPEKNPLRFIEIIKEVQQTKNNIKALIIGNGSLEKDVQEKIKQHKLEKNIKMLGFVNNPFPYLNGAKVLVLTSHYEGIPISALEALALNKPVVSTDVGGISEIIKHGENGFLSNQNEVLAQHIIHCLKKSQLNKTTKSQPNNSQKRYSQYNNNMINIYKK